MPTKPSWCGVSDRWPPAAAQREAGWDNSRPAWGNYIPEYGTPGTHSCVGQIEEHVKRPVTVSGWRARDHRKKETPTLFANSITWNRRHCERDCG